MGLLSYMKPSKGKQDAAPEQPKTEMVERRPTQMGIGSVPGTPGTATPGGASPWASRPASLYPVGDFRNSDAFEINEIKCDVMVNWLYQQQMERLWTAGGHDEGVLLKKGKSAYACAPADLVEEEFGFHRSIQMLNVKVRITST